MLIKWIPFLSIFFVMTSLLGPLGATERSQIKVLVFDFGSVIVKTDKKELANYIAQSLHVSQDEAMNALKQLKDYNLQRKGEQEFWIDYASSKKIQLPDDWLEKLNQARFQALREIPGMVDLVKNLQGQGYQTALLSNVRKNQAEIKRKLGFYELFNPTLLSYEIEVRKPDPKAYQILLNQLKVPATSVLFIDNKLENIKAAESLGIDGILFVNKDQLISELKKRGIEIASSPKMPGEQKK